MRVAVTVALLVVTTSLFSCGFREKKDAQLFHDRILSINDTVGQLTQQWHTLLDTALNKKNFSELNPVRIQLGAYLSKVRSEVADMRLTERNEVIKNAEDALLSSQIAKVADVYPVFEPYSAFTPKEDLANAQRPLEGDLYYVKSSLKKISALLDDYSRHYSLQKTAGSSK